MPYAVINEITAANNEQVAANPNNKIIVTGYTLIGAASQVLTWKRGTTALSGPMAVGAGIPVYAWGTPENPVFETLKGEALNLTSGFATQVSGHLTYHYG